MHSHSKSSSTRALAFAESTLESPAIEIIQGKHQTH